MGTKVTIETNSYKATKDFGNAADKSIVSSVEYALTGMQALSTWKIEGQRVQDDVDYTR